jgi:hypothetical protein
MPLSNYKVIGKYADEAQARSALNTINACRRDIFYIVWDITSGLCRILPEEDFLDYEDDEPDRWSDLGHYTSEREAETAFRTFDQCKPIHVARDKKTGFCKIRTFSQDASDLDYERVGDRYWTVEEAEKAMDASESCKHEANGTATITTPNASIASPTSNWQTPEVFDKMANELSVCAAYYEKLSIARPEETQWIFFSKKASGYAALQTELAGLKPETATARYKVALDDMSRRIDKNPTDVSILIADYDDLCNEAMFSPDKRGRYWLERLTTPLQ